MTTVRYTILSTLLAVLLLAGCRPVNTTVAPWSLADTELRIRCGETYTLPFTGGSADYTIHNTSPGAADVMAVTGATPHHPEHDTQALVISGKTRGTTHITVTDNRTDRSVCIVLHVVNPYIALMGSQHTDPGQQDRLLAWDTDLYLNSDGRFILTTFTDGMPIKPGLITRGTYTVTPAPDGTYSVTITPSDLKLPPQTYTLAADDPLAALLDAWNIDIPDSDLALSTMPNRSDGRVARYMLTPSRRLPEHLSF